MDRDTIIRLAREVGLWDVLEVQALLPELERFAALVAAHEREACAKVLEEHPSYDFCRCPCECAAAIRSRK